jgi:hypothetical protein
MRRLHLYFVLSAFVSLSVAFGQTGPGGVGTSANNVLWLKADVGTSTTTPGASVSTWNDMSGNGINVSQTLPAQQPVFQSNVINGIPAVQFDNNSAAGQNDKMLGPDSPLLDNTAGYTFFTVSRPQNIACNSIVSKRVDVGVHQSFMLFYYTSNLFHVDIQSNNDRFASATPFSNNNNYLIDLVYDGTLPAASRSKLYVGEALNKVSYETSSFVPDNNSFLAIGTTHPEDPRPFAGYISEVVIYREALNKASRIIVNNYLSAKYDIALTANDKYAGDNAANGDYDMQVAGIGTDTIQPAGTLGSNTAFAPSSTGGFGLAQVSGFQAGDYILAGHRMPVNSAIATDVAGLTGTAVCRWNRNWYVDVTNFGANMVVDATFDMSDGGVSPAIAIPANYKLLYRAGQTGAWTVLATANSISGDQVIFSGVALTTDGYYTIGSINCFSSPLPVVLTAFDAEPADRAVDLEWTTATENNSAFFNIFRSSDSQSWQHLQSVPAAGSSLAPLYYSWTDASPSNGVSYYRLELEDLDGSLQDLGIRSVSYNGDENLLIYPNPADDMLYLSNGSRAIGEIVLADQQGRVVYSASESGSGHSIDLRALKSGIYFLKTSAGTFPVARN